MRVPHTCPVCAGRGNLPAGFYEGTPSSIYGHVGCRTCSGAGIVWDPLETPAVAPWAPGLPQLPYVGDPLPASPPWPSGPTSPFQSPFTTWVGGGVCNGVACDTRVWS